MKLFGKKPAVCGAILVAAGSAARMQGIDKVMEPVGGIPMIVRTALVFEQCPLVDTILIVTRKELAEKVNILCQQYGIGKLAGVVIGGDTRAESVRRGLMCLPKACGLVAVHDGARPLVTCQIVEDAIQRARRTNAAAPAVPVKDTIKIAQKGEIQSTPDRSTLFAVQTPQVFDVDLLSAALENGLRRNLTLTDECSAVEALGKVVYLTEGSDENLKVTTPVDLALAEAILNWRECK